MRVLCTARNVPLQHPCVATGHENVCPPKLDVSVPQEGAPAKQLAALRAPMEAGSGNDEVYYSLELPSKVQA